MVFLLLNQNLRDFNVVFEELQQANNLKWDAKFFNSLSWSLCGLLRLRHRFGAR